MKEWLVSALIVLVGIFLVLLVWNVFGYLPFVLATVLFVFSVLVHLIHYVLFTDEKKGD